MTVETITLHARVTVACRHRQIFVKDAVSLLAPEGLSKMVTMDVDTSKIYLKNVTFDDGFITEIKATQPDHENGRILYRFPSSPWYFSYKSQTDFVPLVDSSCSIKGK